MFEIRTKNNSSYPECILANRNINCSTVTKEEFVNALSEDLTEALHSFAEICVPKQIEVMTKHHNEYVESARKVVIRDATAYAERTWRTEKRRAQYVADAVAEFNAKNSNYKPYWRNLSFFDLDGNCESVMGVKIIIDADDVSPEHLSNHIDFDYLCDTRFFRKAIGWKIGYEANAETYAIAFRPWIKLVFDDTDNQSVSEAQKKLGESVANFYKNTTYFGD